MKRNIVFGLLLVTSITLLGFSIYSTSAKEPIKTDAIDWITFEEAIAKQKNNPRKIFIDFYTDWCGWCKVMDSKTFNQPEVIEHINTNYYAVKFDAEQKEKIVFNGKSYAYVKAGRRGVHELAYKYLKPRLSYPAYVVLDENQQPLKRLSGFMPPAKLLNQLEN